MSTPSGNRGLAKYGTTIFEVMSSLARDHGAINLAQGFPDGDGPDDVRAQAAQALLQQSNQYAPMMGLGELRRAVAEHDRRFYDLDLDPESEVMVSSGATEALASSLLGLLEPGDEVVVFEPFYDSYVPMIERAGGIARFVRLHAPDWRVEQGALEAAFTDRTRVVIVNSPMNPSGKVFSIGELDAIAELAIRHQAVCLCDEVYEHLTFGSAVHVPLMTRPGMRDRCIRIGSAGKTFSLTGWKVGYVSACQRLIAAIARAHQFVVFSTPPNLQRAVAYGLGKSDSFYASLRGEMQGKRDRLRAGLESVGFLAASCEGTYFINADYSRHRSDLNDLDFAHFLAVEAGVAVIPLSPFYADNVQSRFVRFCFCKEDATLDAALTRLGDFFR